MTPKEKLLKQIEDIDCNEIHCLNCPLYNDNEWDCEKNKFKKICRERFKPKICSKCGQELKG